MPLPDKFLDRLNRILPPAKADSIIASFQSPKLVSFRVNTLLTSEREVTSELHSARISFKVCKWLDTAFTVDAQQRELLTQSESAQNGHIYIQNLSSMLPVLELDPRPDESVLDLTAAPGSKTSMIAAIMQNTGYIAAVESVRSRHYKLRTNLDRLGVTNVRTFLKDGRSIYRHRPDYFDRVLIDAPCSSEGRFRTDEPETTRYWSERKIAEMKRKQIQLLQSAVRCARVGGTIVYSTCSFAPEENEEIVTRILKRCGSFIESEPLTVDCPNYWQPVESWNNRSFAAGDARRVLPDSTMDGFFIARFTKTAPTPEVRQ